MVRKMRHVRLYKTDLFCWWWHLGDYLNILWIWFYSLCSEYVAIKGYLGALDVVFSTFEDEALLGSNFHQI